MLNPNGNYIHQLADPDINLDWDTIEQVVSLRRLLLVILLKIKIKL
jgi:hypothetical protein